MQLYNMHDWLSSKQKARICSFLKYLNISSFSNYIISKQTFNRVYLFASGIFCAVNVSVDGFILFTLKKIAFHFQNNLFSVYYLCWFLWRSSWLVLLLHRLTWVCKQTLYVSFFFNRFSRLICSLFDMQVLIWITQGDVGEKEINWISSLSKCNSCAFQNIKYLPGDWMLTDVCLEYIKWNQSNS